MTTITLAVAGYVGFQLLLGAWIGRRIRTEEDYLVAGRSLGYPLVVFTLFATWFGAETCVGAAGAIYEHGLAGGSADPFGYGLCIALMGLVFAVRLWKLRLTTFADFFRNRYSVPVERLAVVLMVPTSVLWAAAQIRAFGQVVSAVSGFDPMTTITAAALVVVVYTLMGGLLADVWTDLVQGIALIVGLGVLFVAVVRQHGVEVFATIDRDQLRLLEPDVGLLTHVETWAIPVVGSVAAAELVSRVIAARSPQVARNSAFVAAGAYLLVGLMPVALGLIGQNLLPGLADPEQVLPLLARSHLPEIGYALFAGAILSAILSTADTTLLVSASMVSHNVILPLLPNLGEREKVRLSRIAVAVAGVVAYLLALSAEGVYALVEESSAFGSAGIVTVLVLGLFTRLGGPRAAMASMLGGVVTWVLGAHWVAMPYPFLSSLAVALAAYLVVAGFETAAGDRPAVADAG